MPDGPHLTPFKVSISVEMTRSSGTVNSDATSCNLKSNWE